MALIIVEERFEPAIDAAGLAGYASQLSPCLGTYKATWVGSYVARDGSQCVCIYEAPDAESVRMAYRMAETKFEYKVWPATHHTPIDAPG
jgi:Protein of unknown function (DUF4242)